MLTEERYGKILNLVKEYKTITVAQLTEELNASESTIRRDLNTLASKGKIIKVHGGATIIDDSFDFSEHPVETKEKLFSEEKTVIAKYAASTIKKNDFVFIDAGTTTEKMIDFITEMGATYVTNGFTHAKKLAKKQLKVYIVGGQLKASTEAVIGTECVDALKKFNFTKCFMGTNGISLSAGLTTPDIDEANVKSTVIKNSYISYVLADHSKFNQISSVTFGETDKVCIITDIVPDEKYKEKCVIKEVM
ncbi:MAG: DeoR/GlpR family DNA-binding transcription regulator [Ruminococcus sp.]|nr:DeoR/GlpR family DNA-binding transcription regulator [Ruminococcus sp.]